LTPSGGHSQFAAWAAVGLLWFAFAINYLDRQMIFSMFPLLRRDFHFSEAQLGLVGTVFLWVYSLCMPLSGRLADLVRRDRIIVASVILWSLATLGTGLSRSMEELLAWRAAMGVSEALYMPAAVGMIATLHGAANRSKALGIHASAQYGGIVAGGWYGGWIADRGEFRFGFLAVACVGLAYAAVLALLLRRPSQLPTSQRASASVALRSLANPRYLALMGAFFSLCVMLWMLYAWFPTLLYERFGLSMTESGLAATLYLQVTSAVGIVIGGVLGDRLARRWLNARALLESGGLLLAAPLAFISLTQSLEMAKLSVAGFGLFTGMMAANTFASVYDAVPREHDGFAVGVLNMMGGLAGGAAIALAGLWKASFGIAALMQAASAIAVVFALALWFVNRKSGRVQVQEEYT